MRHYCLPSRHSLAEAEVSSSSLSSGRLGPLRFSRYHYSMQLGGKVIASNCPRGGKIPPAAPCSIPLLRHAYSEFSLAYCYIATHSKKGGKQGLHFIVASGDCRRRYRFRNIFRDSARQGYFCQVSAFVPIVLLYTYYVLLYAYYVLLPLRIFCPSGGVSLFLHGRIPPRG